MDPLEKIKAIEEEIFRTQKNKATESHIGLLKAKMAKLRRSSEKKGGGKSVTTVKKEGDATVSMVGFPSVGKSTLLNLITGARSKTAAYQFTTTDCIPGVMHMNGAMLQILDLPGIIEGAHEGKGMGKAILSYARISDLLMLITDIERIDYLNYVVDELLQANFRLNEGEPEIEIKQLERGGMTISSTFNDVNKKLTMDILMEFGIHNAKVLFREKFDVERLVDRLARNRKYINCIVVINKDDESETKVSEVTLKGKRFKALRISALNSKNITKLKDLMWESLNLIRVFTIRRTGQTDDRPMIMPRKTTVRDLCNKLHRDFESRFRFARIKGKSAKFDGQKVGLEHELKDMDSVMLFLR